MPPCKNDPSKNYKGDEPSPKGLGYCAHAEKEGNKKIGKDGNTWIVVKDKNKVGKWIKYDNTYNKLESIFNKWWQILAEEGIMFIYDDGKYKMVVGTKKTKSARIKEVHEKLIYEGVDDPTVVAIIYSAMSRDTIQEFIKYIIKKKYSDEILKAKDPIAYLAKNYKKFFYRYPLVSGTKKDYTFRR